MITSPYTFYATIGAIVTAGAKPIFADIGADYNIDPAEIEKVITPKTKAIVPIHWSGLICDMPSIRAIADKHNLAIVEDACHAIGALRHGHSAGACRYGVLQHASAEKPQRVGRWWGDCYQ